MDLVSHFRLMAQYNRAANQRIFEACAHLDDAEYRKTRKGSFGSIHALLNHILVGDRIWMARFEGGGSTTPRLGRILFDDFDALSAARVAEDARIEDFFERLDPAMLDRPLTYTNSEGKEYTDRMPVAVGHLFNHQTHHRGQVHVMLAQTAVPPPSLDLHRIINP
jgi:uncharacterized damage-inducible protein DinB